MNAWFVAMTILLGVGARILHRYDVRRVLIWIAFVWFVPGALLLGYRSEHLCVIAELAIAVSMCRQRRAVSFRLLARSLRAHVSAAASEYLAT